MSGRLQDRVAIITGAGSVGPGWGNGKATAVRGGRTRARARPGPARPASAPRARVLAARRAALRTQNVDILVSGLPLRNIRNDPK